MKNLKKIPSFKNEEEEIKFWDEHDSSDYIDWNKSSKTYFPKLKSTSESISIRLPSSLLTRLKIIANKKDVPYQSLMKIYLSEQINKELLHK